MRSLVYAALLCPSVALSSDLIIGAEVVDRPTCNTPNGIISLSIQGGVPPVNILWNDGVAGVTFRDDLAAGTYTVTATDAEGNTAVREFELQALPYLYLVQPSYIFDQSNHFPCPGTDNGSAMIPLYASFDDGLYNAHGVPPFTFNAQLNGSPVPAAGTDGNGNPWFADIRQGAVLSYSYTDAVGCGGAVTWIAPGPTDTILNILGTTPACLGASNGSIEAALIFGTGGADLHFNVRDLALNVVRSMYYDNNHSCTDRFSIDGLATGTYTVEMIYSDWPPGTVCDGYFTGPVVVGELPVECGIVEGTLYIDHDQDCAQGPDEPGIPGRLLEIMPGPVHAITDQQGRFTRSLPNGYYTMEVLGEDLWPLCPATVPVPFTINSDVVTVDLADSSIAPLDLVARIESGAARPGFVHDLWMDVQNLSARMSGATTVTLTFDAALSFISAEPLPTSISGNVVVWELTALQAYASRSFGVSLQVPPNPALLGLNFTHEVMCAQPLAESDLQNNARAYTGTFTGSYDPNDKTARTGSRASDLFYVLGTDSYIDYVIRFQNTGTDTAFTVVVIDTLDQDLDISTFQQGIASHPFEVRFKDDRVVEWRFANILLPDSNTNEPASHGLVSFRIAPTSPVFVGNTFLNNADIYFDFNPPIRTNDAVLVAVNALSVPDAERARFGVFPNPASTKLTLQLSGALLVGDLRITAMDGRVVHRQRAADQVDVSRLLPGMYELSLAGADGRRHTTRFVKE